MNRVDFDFPCSRLFRSYSAYQNGEYLPPLGDIRLPEESASEGFWAKVSKSARIPNAPKWSNKQWDTVQQLQGQMLHLEKKIDTLLTSRKPARGRDVSLE